MTYGQIRRWLGEEALQKVVSEVQKQLQEQKQPSPEEVTELMLKDWDEIEKQDPMFLADLFEPTETAEQLQQNQKRRRVQEEGQTLMMDHGLARQLEPGCHGLPDLAAAAGQQQRQQHQPQQQQESDARCFVSPCEEAAAGGSGRAIQPAEQRLLPIAVFPSKDPLPLQGPAGIIHVDIGYNYGMSSYYGELDMKTKPLRIAKNEIYMKQPLRVARDLYRNSLHQPCVKRPLDLLMRADLSGAGGKEGDVKPFPPGTVAYVRTVISEEEHVLMYNVRDVMAMLGFHTTRAARDCWNRIKRDLPEEFKLRIFESRWGTTRNATAEDHAAGLSFDRSTEYADVHVNRGI